MDCESGAVSSLCNYASGEGSKHILIFDDFLEIRISYVFSVQSVTRIFCNQKSIVFIMSNCKNRSATAFFRRRLQNLCGIMKNMRSDTEMAHVRFTNEYKVESVTCDQHDGV